MIIAPSIEVVTNQALSTPEFRNENLLNNYSNLANFNTCFHHQEMIRRIIAAFLKVAARLAMDDSSSNKITGCSPMIDHIKTMECETGWQQGYL